MPRKAASGEPEATIFGVYQLETGSYTLDETRFVPFKAVPCGASVKDAACEDTSPVKFFDDEQKAKDEAARLKLKAEAKRNPKPKED